MVKRVLAIADLHVGSNVGLFVPNYTNPDTHVTYELNAIQNYLFEQWCKMVEMVGNVDVLILNGDLVDGTDPVEGGTGVVTTCLHTQAVVAATLIDMIQAREIIVVEGSAFHTGKRHANISGDRMVCDLVDGRYIGFWDTIAIDDIKVNIRHVDKWSENIQGRVGAQQKEAEKMRVQETTADIYIRSHTHKFNFSGNPNDITIGTPCFKGIDEFVGKKSQVMPDNGGIVIDIDGADYNWKYNIFKIPFQLYKKGLIKL